jgi:flagellar export protein FliJ
MSRLARYQLLVDLAEKQKDTALQKLSEALRLEAQLLQQQMDLKAFQHSLGTELVAQPQTKIPIQSFQNRMFFLDQLQRAMDGQAKSADAQSLKIERFRQVLTHRQMRLQAMEKLLIKAQKQADQQAARKEEQELEAFGLAMARQRRG